METHNIDSIFKKAIDESENFYGSEANASKERIWNNVQHKKRKPVPLILFWSLAAACIILFFSTTVITISNIKAKDKIKNLVALNKSLKNDALAKNHNSTIKTEPEEFVVALTPDTVYIEKEVIISKPIVTTKVIVDTVIVEQIVYVEKETPRELLALNDTINQTDSSSQIIADSYETKILIRNSEKGKKEKKKKFQFKFWGNRSKDSNTNLAFTKNF